MQILTRSVLKIRISCSIVLYLICTLILLSSSYLLITPKTILAQSSVTAPSISSNNNNSIQWKTYRSDNFGVSFEIPNNWTDPREFNLMGMNSLNVVGGGDVAGHAGRFSVINPSGISNSS